MDLWRAVKQIIRRGISIQVRACESKSREIVLSSIAVSHNQQASMVLSNHARTAALPSSSGPEIERWRDADACCSLQFYLAAPAAPIVVNYWSLPMSIVVFGRISIFGF